LRSSRGAVSTGRGEASRKGRKRRKKRKDRKDRKGRREEGKK
jgi:hypothetical protein